MKIAFIGVAAGLMAGGAFAGGFDAPVAEAPIVTPMSPVRQGMDWTGFYAGLQFGTGDISALGASVDFDAFGAHAGYLWDRGSYVVGAELDYNDIEADGGGSGDLVRLRGRVGADLGRFLPYITLGAGRLSAGGETESGLNYGIGADYLLTNSISFGLEYTRNEFDDVLPGLDMEADLLQLRVAYRF